MGITLQGWGMAWAGGTTAASNAAAARTHDAPAIRPSSKRLPLMMVSWMLLLGRSSCPELAGTSTEGKVKRESWFIY